MKITKSFMKDVLQEVKEEYSAKILPIKAELDLSFIEKEEFLKEAKENGLIQQQIQLGMYRNFEEEYPNFVVVYQSDKHPLRDIMGLPYVISVCLDIARKKLKPFTPAETRAYLKYVFAHEITHIVEEELKMTRPDLWEAALHEAKGNESHAHELLAEDIGRTFGILSLYKRVEESLWGVIYNRIKKIETQRGY